MIVRAGAVTLFAWLPLLVFSAAQGQALGRSLDVPFLRDFAANARFLIALPVLIVAEVTIDCWLRKAVRHFLQSELVNDRDLPAFENIIDSVTKLRDRAAPEILLFIFAFVVSVLFYNPEVLMRNVPAWHLTQTAAGERLSYAGWWLRFVSMPVYRFLLFRWVWRMALWAFFLRRVSKLNLGFTPIHPDGAGGSGFLASAQVAFSLVGFACGVVLSGQIGNAIAYEGATVDSLKFIIIAYCAAGVMALVAPLLLLVPALSQVKRRGLLEYGVLATCYTQSFHAKWIQGMPAQHEPLLGTPDIQSLADLGNSFAIVKGMKVFPIFKNTLIKVTIAIGLPIVPVLILATPADKLLQTVVRLLT